MLDSQVLITFADHRGLLHLTSSQSTAITSFRDQYVVIPRACARGKVIGRVVVIVSTKIAIS